MELDSQALTLYIDASVEISTNRRDRTEMRTLVNLNPSAEYRAIEEVFDRLMGTSHRPSQPPTSVLPIDISEHEGKLFVRAAVPGVDPSELEIQIERNVLTIRGESKSSSSSEEKVYRREVSYGAFSRSVRLPEGLNYEAVDAEFNNGLVTITLPRIPEEKPKSFKVNVRSAQPIEAAATETN